MNRIERSAIQGYALALTHLYKANSTVSLLLFV